MRTNGSVPVTIAAKVYGKDPSWVRAGIISGYLPIWTATKNGKKVESVDEINSTGRINYYISPKLLFEHTGFNYEGGKMQQTSNRIQELKYFCKQYYEWEEAVKRIDSEQNYRIDPLILPKNHGKHSDPTANKAIARGYYVCRMNMVKRCCKKTSGDNFLYLFDSVTYDLNYKDLLKKYGVLPITADDLYLMRKRFFKELSGERG